MRSQLTDQGCDGYRASVAGCEWPELWSLDNRPCSRWSRNNWWIPLAGKAEGKTFSCLLATSNALTWSVKVACDALTLAGWLWVKYRLLIRRVVTLFDADVELPAAMFGRKKTVFRWIRMDQQSIHTNDLSSECRVIFLSSRCTRMWWKPFLIARGISESWGRTWSQTVEILSYWNLGVSLTDFRRLRSTASLPWGHGLFVLVRKRIKNGKKAA